MDRAKTKIITLSPPNLDSLVSYISTWKWDGNCEMLLSEDDFNNLLFEYRNRNGQSMPVPLVISGVKINQSDSPLLKNQVKTIDRSLEDYDLGKRLTYGTEIFALDKIFLCRECDKPVNGDGSIMEPKDKAYREKFIRDYGRGKVKLVDGECCEHVRMVKEKNIIAYKGRI